MDPVSELLLRFFEFNSPRTKHVDFNGIIGGALSFEARELLGVTTSQRSTLMDALDNSGQTVDPRNISAAVENYLPSVYKLTHSMEQSAGAHIKLNKPLEFSWTSVLLKKSKQNVENKCQVLVYEVCFVLTVQALAHYNAAKNLVCTENPSRMSNLVAAAKEVRKGAGILEYVSQVLIPRWTNPPKNRAPEVVGEVVLALCGLFCCMGQRLTVVQGLQRGLPPSAIAKLLFGLSERYSQINQQLRSLDKSLYDSLLDSLLDEPAILSVACYALGAQMMGEKAKADGEPGKAVGYLLLASNKLAGILYNPSTEELLKEYVVNAQHAVDEKFHQYKADNESIYFEGVPTADALDIPKGSFMCNPLDYSLPEVSAVSFASTDGGIESAEAMNAPDGTQGDSGKSSGGSMRGALSWFGFGGGKKDNNKEEDTSEAAGSDDFVPPGYDRDVFTNLPPDIKKEVLAAYRAENKSPGGATSL
uniref:BRO1 domain-containing protein n=1 Tax=Mucochytrium quahogii TaxID=96639 RepID=A0A7S2R628_9STRA